MSPLIRKALTICLGLFSAAAVTFAAVHWIPTVHHKPRHAHLDMASPDAVIVSQNLRQLPRDLLAVPLLHDTLSEDFVFYYEDNDERLTLSGALKRIAYEHDLSIGDEVVSTLLDQPAEIALWRGVGGKLDHYLLAVKRNGIGTLLQAAVQVVAAKDAQLDKAGDIKLDNDTLTVYALHHGRDHTLFFTGLGERLLVATDASLLLGADDETPADGGQRRQRLQQLLHGDAGSNPYVQQFALGSSHAKQSIAVSTRYLSFGYAQLFPGVNALRFDFGNGQWSSWGWFDGSKVNAAALDAQADWSAMPAGAALCSAVPLHWDSLTDTVAALSKDGAASPVLLASMDAPLAVCWYRESSIYTPLFIASGKNLGAQQALLAKIFTAAVGQRMHGLPPVGALKLAQGELWQRQIPSIYASQGKHFTVSGAQIGDRLLFSPDAALVNRAQAVLNARYPAMADTLPKAPLALIVQPQQLGQLLQQEALSSLPADSEPVFNEAAKKHLLPRLQALQKFPAFALTYPRQVPNGIGWLALSWQPVAGVGVKK